MDKKHVNPSFFLIITVIGILGIYLFAHFGNAIDTAPKQSTGAVDIVAAFSIFENNIGNPRLVFDSITDRDTYTFKFALAGIVGGLLWLVYALSNLKNYRKREEHGSASWATKKDAKELLDSKGEKNAIILTDDVSLGLNTRETQTNLNVAVLGGSGAGKSRFYVKPNIMQMNTSYVVTDPKGELLRDTGKMLVKNGYTVKVLNLVNMKNSFNYNPFAYLQDVNGNYSDANVVKLINVLMKNTKKEGQSGGDQFWEDSTEALFLALAYYLVYEGNEDEKNFPTMMDLLLMGDAREDDEDYKSGLDYLFEDLEELSPEHPAVKYYKIFKMAAGKTAKSILISAAVRLKAFNNQEVRNLTSTDSINIHEIGEKKTALFVVIPDKDDTFNFLVAMLYTQMFDILYDLADFKYDGRLPVHVRFLLDEFANIGSIPNFDKLIATMRSREISANPILQNLAQIKRMYKDSWESILGNCDSLLFLGGKEPSSLKYVSEALGKETIDTLNRNVSRSSRGGNTSRNEGIVGRYLMTPDEIERMSKKKCILLVRGTRPFYGNKYRLKRHHNYNMLGDYSERNAFDISSIVTKEMPRKNLLDPDPPIDLHDPETEETIRDILNSEEGVELVSEIDIPDNQEESEIVYQVDTVDGFETEKSESEQTEIIDDDYVIEDLVIEETDEFSELNTEDFIIDESDEVHPGFLDDDQNIKGDSDHD